MEAREVQGGVGDGRVAPVDDTGDDVAIGQDVLGTEVTVGEDEFSGRFGSFRAQPVQQGRRPRERLEPLVGGGDLGGHQTAHGRRVDAVQLAQDMTQPGGRTGGCRASQQWAPRQQRVAEGAQPGVDEARGGDVDRHVPGDRGQQVGLRGRLPRPGHAHDDVRHQEGTVVQPRAQIAEVLAGQVRRVAEHRPPGAVA